MKNSINHLESKRIAIVSYHSRKKELVEWAYENKQALAGHRVIAAGTTAGILEGILGGEIEKIPSVLAGGDKQLAEMIREKRIDIVLFFCEVGKPNKRNGAVKQLIQLAMDNNLVLATNLATARVVLGSLTPRQKKGVDAYEFCLAMNLS